MVFFDSSALVKAYLDEDGTGVVVGALDCMAGRLYISDFVALEVLASLRTAFRDATPSKWREVVDEVQSDLGSLFNIVDVDPAVLSCATKLVVDHPAGARPLDGRAAPRDSAARSGERSCQAGDHGHLGPRSRRAFDRMRAADV